MKHCTNCSFTTLRYGINETWNYCPKCGLPLEDRSLGNEFPGDIEPDDDPLDPLDDGDDPLDDRRRDDLRRSDGVAPLTIGEDGVAPLTFGEDGVVPLTFNTGTMENEPRTRSDGTTQSQYQNATEV